MCYHVEIVASGVVRTLFSDQYMRKEILRTIRKARKRRHQRYISLGLAVVEGEQRHAALPLTMETVGLNLC